MLEIMHREIIFSGVVPFLVFQDFDSTDKSGPTANQWPCA